MPFKFANRSFRGHAFPVTRPSRLQLLTVESLHRPLRACVFTVPQHPIGCRGALLLDATQRSDIGSILGWQDHADDPGHNRDVHADAI